MLRSLMTAVTGVKAHQVMLDVTGNNIANVNTTGFKKDFTIFQDLLYQTSRGATGPGDALGGTNPVQVGLGVKVGAIETIHTQGFASYTDNPLDVMIEGEGYYVMRDGNSRLYSRAGNFILDANNNMAHSGTGYLVQGYKMARDPMNPSQFIEDGDISDINIPMGKKLEARATSLVGFRCNLDSRLDPYLPIGFKDIPFGGDDGNDMDAVVNIGDKRYNLTAETNLYGYTPNATTSAGAAYITYTFESPTGAGTEASISLAIDQLIAPTGSPSPLLTLIGDNGQPVNTATIHLPDGSANGLTAGVSYNQQTGMLRIFSMGYGGYEQGATLREISVTDSMSYNTFSVESTSATAVGLDGAGTYNFMLEFDEGSFDGSSAGKVIGTGSPVTMTLWYQLEGNDTVHKASIAVPMKANGEFDLTSALAVNGLTDFGLKIQAAENTNGTLNGEIMQIMAKDPGANAAEPGIVGSVQMSNRHQTKFSVYDCQGYEYTMEILFKKISENLWRWEAYFPDEPSLSVFRPSGELVFDQSCLLIEPSPGYVDVEVPYSLLGRENSTIRLDFSGESFGLDNLEGVTQFADTSTTKMKYQDGYKMGVLEGFDIGGNGIIYGRYSNDQVQALARIALAQFANPQGLEKVGDTMFAETINSGNARISGAQVDGAGKTVSGALEMSNVDLTEEFTRLIIAQRGFQANTRVVTTSDQILEEVVNLKR